MNLSVDQVLALAPDASSAKAGRGLAGPAPWSRLGRDERAVWGECQGSGKLPYQTQVDQTGPAFHCSCPSRKFPCKHGLGLLLLLAEQPARFQDGAPPEWVTKWLAMRDTRSEAKEAKSRDEKPVDAEAQAKRAAKRASNIQAGFEELNRWLADLVRQGLASAPAKPYAFWEQQAARLMDAQAPGAARLVRELGSAAASGGGWQNRMLRQMARLKLLVEGYSRIDTLPEPLQQDLRAAAGLPQSQEAVLAGAAVRDRWQVLGCVFEQVERIRMRKTWLWASEQRHAALVLDFSAAGAGFSNPLVPGTAFTADLCFYPGSWPLRAIVREISGPIEPLSALRQSLSLSEAAAWFGSAVGANPFLDSVAVALHAVVPRAVGKGAWALFDGETDEVWPLRQEFADIWKMVAVAGGRNAGIAGEWDGDTFQPTAICQDGRMVALAGSVAA